MVGRNNWNSYFEQKFDGFFIKPYALEKIEKKHSVYESELEDALDDPCWVINKNNKSGPLLPNGVQPEGEVFDIFCETSEGRLLKVVGRLYEGGRFQIITVLPGNKISINERQYYIREKELICSD
ncbi:hypothetical protein [Bacillus sp. SJS]|uniref:hypothetical protein n=1 Tax=Bacillus sp. SJS TaxID=1423321 RepID=UPI0004DCDD22|nr:hypothetical protein [Bacillus sp. SJS]KZZ83931.1 hypothetical protein AS29_014390 [Bacillus sp. SJS]